MDLLVESLMRASLIEVGDIDVEHATELPLVQDEQVIEALPAHTPQEAFTAAIGSRRAQRCSQELEPGPAGHLRKELTELAFWSQMRKRGHWPKGVASRNC
jgi:hypothetical protein